MISRVSTRLMHYDWLAGTPLRARFMISIGSGLVPPTGMGPDCTGTHLSHRTLPSRFDPRLGPGIQSDPRHASAHHTPSERGGHERAWVCLPCNSPTRRGLRCVRRHTLIPCPRACTYWLALRLRRHGLVLFNTLPRLTTDSPNLPRFSLGSGIELRRRRRL